MGLEAIRLSDVLSGSDVRVSSFVVLGAVARAALGFDALGFRAPVRRLVIHWIRRVRLGRCVWRCPCRRWAGRPHDLGCRSAAPTPTTTSPPPAALSGAFTSGTLSRSDWGL